MARARKMGARSEGAFGDGKDTLLIVSRATISIEHQTYVVPSGHIVKSLLWSTGHLETDMQ